MNILLLLLLFLFCAVIFLFVWWFCHVLSKPSSVFYVLDKVNDRSMHTQPKPRTGGIAVVCAILLAWLLCLLFSNDEFTHYSLIIGIMILSVVSYLDDRCSVSTISRLFIHIIVAVFMVYSLLQVSGSIWVDGTEFGNWFLVSIVLTMVIVWSINLYNFMDGMDGLAGGMGFIGFGCLAWFGWASDNHVYFLLTIVIATANLGFLAHNYPPAKIFMGDIGSTVMGYLVAFFSLWGIQSAMFLWWVPLLVFSPFIIDATVTLIRRIYCGERFWEAHKSHYYQKLVQVGFGQNKTLVIEYILMLSVACTSIMLYMINDNKFTTIFLLVWLVIYICIIYLIEQKLVGFRGES